MEQYPSILGEFNFKLEKDVHNKKFVFLDQYLKENKISAADYEISYLPLLVAFNQHSTSTPARLVQCPNRPGIFPKPNSSSQQESQYFEVPAELINCEDDLSTRPKYLMYNDCIKNYDLSLLTPNKITVNHLLSVSPILGTSVTSLATFFWIPRQHFHAKFSCTKVKRILFLLWT